MFSAQDAQQELKLWYLLGCLGPQKTMTGAVLSVRFEVGVSLLLATAGADKRGPKVPFPVIENAGIKPAILWSSGRCWVLLKALQETCCFRICTSWGWKKVSTSFFLVWALPPTPTPHRESGSCLLIMRLRTQFNRMNISQKKRRWHLPLPDLLC